MLEGTLDTPFNAAIVVLIWQYVDVRGQGAYGQHIAIHSPYSGTHPNVVRCCKGNERVRKHLLTKMQS